ncbi:MAG: helix-turn-helix domain-containing protein [Alphaproteobacteria bacterium]|nr:helix-turn-helix domain-containing protein [Alphaproteobacteria bacterium]MCW5740002.1 helix-turn-helix domain-containing protein [Alphaproteobacteria bacterium]
MNTSAPHLVPRSVRPAVPRVLVVEDNHLAAEGICDLVRDHGFEVAAMVGTLDKALAAARHGALDGAVLDINLHGVNSFPVCSLLQQRGIPFLFVTGYPDTALPPELRASDLLAKPVEPSTFRLALDTMIAGTSTRTGNLLLDTLPLADRLELTPLLKPVALIPGRLIDSRQHRSASVVFPTGGLVSLTGEALGRTIEIGLTGFEGATGLTSLLGTPPAFDARVDVEGSGYRLDARLLERRLLASDAFGRHMLAYSHALLAQVTQSAIAHGHGTVAQRVARRLLMAQDRLRASRLVMTHESLALALGVRRASVTIALQVLEGEGFIRATRKSVQIVDRDRLVRSVEGIYQPLPAEISGASPRAAE